MGRGVINFIPPLIGLAYYLSDLVLGEVVDAWPVYASSSPTTVAKMYIS